MNSNDIVQLLGVIYLVFGLSFIFNKKYYKDFYKEMTKSKISMFFWWVTSLVIGFILILNFNEWTMTRVWLVTFIWWAALVKWIILLLFPKFMIDLTNAVTKPKYFNLIWYGVTIYEYY